MRTIGNYLAGPLTKACSHAIPFSGAFIYPGLKHIHRRQSLNGLLHQVDNKFGCFFTICADAFGFLVFTDLLFTPVKSRVVFFPSKTVL
jgi:hypothetical protein